MATMSMALAEAEGDLDAGHGDRAGGVRRQHASSI
jgi:hypothetical protein